MNDNILHLEYLKETGNTITSDTTLYIKWLEGKITNDIKPDNIFYCVYKDCLSKYESCPEWCGIDACKHKIVKNK